MTPTLTQAAATAVVVALALGLAAFLPYGPNSATSSSPSSVSGTALDGLQFTLSVNSTTIRSGQTFGINVSEYNTLNSQNNISVASNWLVQGQLGACGDNVYPYGVSVFSGHVGLGNVSQASPLQVYPFVPCPLFLRLVTGYIFQPMSENATILPGNSSLLMSSQVSVARTYTGGSPQGQALAPGQYTLAASDEWGGILFLYLTVT